MKTKHNKKRNTAFVYEALLKEATVAVLKKEQERRNKAVDIIKKYFSNDSILKADLECYRSLYENQYLEIDTCEKIIKEAKSKKSAISSTLLFDTQSKLIADINKELSATIFNNYVPNYKHLATIDQIFSGNVSPKKQIVLESQVLNLMKGIKNERKTKDKVDDVAYNMFLKKFNSKYEESLLVEQKELLKYYIASFADNALELKVFLNEEIGRLKEELAKAKITEDISNDKEMLKKTDTIIEKLNGFASSSIEENVLVSVMKIQQLVKEIQSDADNS